MFWIGWLCGALCGYGLRGVLLSRRYVRELCALREQLESRERG